jgi:TPP-dependent pyruvate/acetoin dehydrogenase alpha subunit
VIPVDGHDAVAVYRVATEAITHARKGNGATIIECIFDAGGEADALRRMEEYLTRKSLFRAAWKRKIAAEFAARLGEALSRQAC